MDFSQILAARYDARDRAEALSTRADEARSQGSGAVNELAEERLAPFLQAVEAELAHMQGAAEFVALFGDEGLYVGVSPMGARVGSFGSAGFQEERRIEVENRGRHSHRLRITLGVDSSSMPVHMAVRAVDRREDIRGSAPLVQTFAHAPEAGMTDALRNALADYVVEHVARAEPVPGPRL